jgi:hypothetical protein
MSVSSIGIEPLSTQIIGVGQVVTFPVIPIVGEGTEAVLQVDRLPRGATFDVNPLGVRVFRWETNEGDEGEHVFRISVLDKDRPGNRAHKDVSVIVGNPTVNSTLPIPLSGGQAPMLDVPEMLSVRVGQSVQFRIASANPGGSPPTISMSQFPIGATLHANPDGSQQFHWQPQSAQVGEHIVSFMAQHTGTANLESYSDVVLHVAP